MFEEYKNKYPGNSRMQMFVCFLREIFFYAKEKVRKMNKKIIFAWRKLKIIITVKILYIYAHMSI